MKIKQANYTGHPFHSFHGDDPAEIVGVRWVQPKENSPWRLTLWVRYQNGDEDFVPLEEAIENRYINRGPAWKA